MNLTVIIADDEPLVRKSVRRFLMDYDVEVLEECGDGASTLAALRAKRPDILFLDMEMPIAKGMELLAQIGEKDLPATIILTAHEHYALGAFDFNVADYILKPFGKERFERGLARAMSRRVNADNVSSTEQHDQTAKALERIKKRSYPEHIPVPGRNGRIHLVKTKEIEWVDADENLLMIHSGMRVYELRDTLSSFLQRLDPAVFCRIHRSTVVNVHYIQEIRPWCNGHHIVVLQDGRELRMSRYQRESVERLTGLSPNGGR